MEWHWLYKNENDLPELNKLCISINWNQMVMSGESRISYKINGRVCEFYYENGVQKARIKWQDEGDYNKVVAWAYVDKPENPWEFCEKGTK